MTIDPSQAGLYRDTPFTAFKLSALHMRRKTANCRVGNSLYGTALVLKDGQLN